MPILQSIFFYIMENLSIYNKSVVIKRFVIAIPDTVWLSFFWKLILNFAIVSKWKSDRPVSNTGRFHKIKSMLAGNLSKLNQCFLSLLNISDTETHYVSLACRWVFLSRSLKQFLESDTWCANNGNSKINLVLQKR